MTIAYDLGKDKQRSAFSKSIQRHWSFTFPEPFAAAFWTLPRQLMDSSHAQMPFYVWLLWMRLADQDMLMVAAFETGEAICLWNVP